MNGHLLFFVIVLCVFYVDYVYVLDLPKDKIHEALRRHEKQRIREFMQKQSTETHANHSISNHTTCPYDQSISRQNITSSQSCTNGPEMVETINESMKGYESAHYPRHFPNKPANISVHNSGIVITWLAVSSDVKVEAQLPKLKQFIERLRLVDEQVAIYFLFSPSIQRIIRQSSDMLSHGITLDFPVGNSIAQASTTLEYLQMISLAWRHEILPKNLLSFCMDESMSGLENTDVSSWREVLDKLKYYDLGIAFSSSQSLAPKTSSKVLAIKQSSAYVLDSWIAQLEKSPVALVDRGKFFRL
jgi:hypothetical protein